MASAPRLPPDPKISLEEKGQKPKKEFVAPVLTPRGPSPDVSIPVTKSDQEKGNEVLAKAMGLYGGKKSRKQKKRVQKKTQKRRARK